MRAALVIALAAVAALAPPARGAVVAERLVAVGPVVDGDGVTWAEGGRGADLSIHTLRPDGSIVERWRKAADTRRRHTLMWGQFPGVLAASPTWLAFYTFDERVEEAGSDYVNLTSTDTLWAGRDGALPQPVTGKVGPRGCRYEPEVHGVAVDGDRMAWAESRAACARRTYLPRVTLRAAGRDRVFRLRPGFHNARRVRLAGRYIAWGIAEQGTTHAIVVRDLARDRTVLRVRRRGTGFLDLGDFDLQADGSVVAVASRRRGRYGSQSFVVTASPARPRLRVLADDAYPGRVEAVGGRAVYIRDRDSFTDGLVLLSLASPREKRTVATWTRPQQLAGSFDFDGRRLVYAIADVPEPDDVPPDARGRVVVEELAP